MNRIILYIIFLTLTIPASGGAQSFQQEKFSPLTSISQIDTTKPDTTKPRQRKVKYIMSKNPWMAAGLSALLPGAGQFYNESYWKIGVIAVLGGYFGYVAIKNNGDYKDYRDRYQLSQTPENPNGDLNLKSQRDFFRDQRDRFIIYFGILYLINIVDAYVDAHLYDFDVSESTKLRLGISNGLKLTYSF